MVTRFIAETLLPTRHGNFRLRGYKHSVSRVPVLHGPGRMINFVADSTCLPLYGLTGYGSCVATLQIDGGVTFTEPTAIVSGKVEGQENVSTLPSAAELTA